MSKGKPSHKRSRRVIQQQRNEPVGDSGIAFFRAVAPEHSHLRNSTRAAEAAANRVFAGHISRSPYRADTKELAINLLSGAETRKYRDVGRVSIPYLTDRMYQKQPSLREPMTANITKAGAFESAVRPGVSAIALKFTLWDTDALRTERQAITDSIDELTATPHAWNKSLFPRLILTWVDMPEAEVAQEDLLEVQEFAPATVDLQRVTLYQPSFRRYR